MRSISTNLSSLTHALQGAIETSHISLLSESPLSGDLVHWEASERATGQLTAEQAAQLGTSIQNGSRLLLTFDVFPGTSPLQLGYILPTTGWSTQVRKSHLTRKEPGRILRTDRSFFENGLESLSASINFDIRPTPAVERGQAKYERYDFVHPWLHTSIKAESDFWSRSLLNRDWKVRAQADDLARMPLVVTGRYGAGKVVVVANSTIGIGDSSVAVEFWDSILRWMQSEESKGESLTVKPISNAVIVGSEVELKLENPSSANLPLQVVLRTLSSDGAVLPDLSGEQQCLVSVAPHQSSTISFPVTTPSNGPDDAVCPHIRMQVRVGILSSDGANLLSEQRLLSPPAPIKLKIETDNLWSFPYPFHAPGPNALASFQQRMGAYVGAYAYAPGQSIKGTIILTNGLENLAPHSEVKDLTVSGNKSAMALNDEATGQRLRPNSDKIEAYSMWTGKADADNSLEFALPPESQVTAVVIVSNSEFGNGAIHWPGRIVVEADGREVARVDDLDGALAVGLGQARISFPLCRAKSLIIRLPWVANKKGSPRQEPWLGEICVEGWRGQEPAEVSGRFELNLIDVLSSQQTKILETDFQTAGCSENRISFEAALPKVGGIHFYRLEATFGTVKTGLPILAISPVRSLLPITDLYPSDVPGIAMNVSNGFRQVFHLGTGTQEPVVGWSTPDDLIWSYSRQLKMFPRNYRSSSIRLYLSDADMRHYVTPWCSFPNGALFMPVAAPMIVENLKTTSKWRNSEIVQLTFADSWNSGPDIDSMNGWQDYVQFDQFLRSSLGHGLQGKTHQELEDEIERHYKNEWQGWQLDRYVTGVNALREAFLAEGKTLAIYAQGVPMVAGKLGRDLALTFRGMHDDSTWSMLDESVALTTGREMSNLAFNPVWQISTLNAWGFNSPIYNSWQWHNPVSTTETSRRRLYDDAWRCTHWPGKGYGSIYTYGYTSNVGVAYTMTEQDFQQWWYMQERQSLISPESPLGAGLVISTTKSADPKSIRFTCVDALALDEPRLLTQSFRNLNDAGMSIPFAANASSLGDFNCAAPLVLLNLQDFSPSEIEEMKALHQRGTRLAAFAERASLSVAAAELFTREGTLLIEKSADALTRTEALKAVERLQEELHLPLTFPEGTAGYGFRCQNTSFVVIEDWLELKRRVDMQITKSEGAQKACACNVNDHQSLIVRDNGKSWIVEIPLPSADAVLIALRETLHGS